MLLSQGRTEPGNHAHDELVRLMDAHEEGITNYLRVLLPDAQAVSDCTQDTFLRAYQHLRHGKPVTPGWLYTVARNRAMDEHRKGKRLRSAANDRDLSSTASDTESAVAEDVREVLACLPTGDREVLYLFSVDGFRTAEIAQMLGIREGAVRTRLFRARERFRALYRRGAE